MTTCLFLVDPQRDFMDERDSPMAVKGGIVDMMNLTDLVFAHGDQIDRVVVSLDQHPYNHIAHSEMWLDKRNRHPKPFTQIRNADILEGQWRASVDSTRQLQADYVKNAEEAGASLTIWPHHCITGSRGATMCPRLNYDLEQWANPTRLIHFYHKSNNWSTEHISAFKTIIPRYDDGTTWFNNYLYNAIQADTILIAGEALSHGIKATVLDAIEYASASKIAERMVILEDCTSPRDGFKIQAEEFLHDFCARGGRVARSNELYPLEY